MFACQELPDMTRAVTFMNCTLADGVHSRWGVDYEIADFSQDVLVRILQGQKHFKSDTVDEFFAWVWRVARSVAVDEQRRQERVARCLASLKFHARRLAAEPLN